MLFDLRSGKRRRVIQVVFGVLAFIFFISFVGFGIGSDASGGIFDAFGLGSSGSSSDPQFEQQIEDAEAQLEQDPKDEKALLELAQVRYQAGQFELEADPETGQAVLTEDAQVNFEASLDAWERYLDLEPRKPDPGVASFAAQAYVQVGDAEGAAEAQRIVAEDNPSAGTYGNLAFYLYAAGNIDEGDEAAEIAVAEAEPSQREQIRDQLAQIAEQAQKLQQRAEKQAQQAQQDQGGGQGGAGAAPPPIEDPFGSLGGSGGLGGTAPTAPGAPAP
jgi:tetratricopeptide (TPR) repeat protein